MPFAIRERTHQPGSFRESVDLSKRGPVYGTTFWTDVMAVRRYWRGRCDYWVPICAALGSRGHAHAHQESNK